MAKTRKMSPSMDAWRKHVAKVASAEGVKYGDAMRMANKGKYASEWKQIQASVSKGKKGGQIGLLGGSRRRGKRGGMPPLSPAEFKGGNVDEVEEDMTMSGGDADPYNEPNLGSNAASFKGGRRRKSRKSRSRKGRSKRGGLAIVP
jgi:hypothetical protein